LDDQPSVGAREQPLTATVFRNAGTDAQRWSATHRRRPVRSIQKLLSNRRPVFSGPGLELRDRQTVRAGGAPVPSDLTPRSFQVLWLDHLLHQINV
jgi:hypothetical protein